MFYRGRFINNEEISKQAFLAYQQSGCLPNRDLENWNEGIERVKRRIDYEIADEASSAWWEGY